MSIAVRTIDEITNTATDTSGTTYIPISQNGTTKKITASNLITYDLPIGSVQMFAGATAPTNWFFCDGSALARSTYSTLFTVIGTAWGVGDGTNTFNIPDMRESAPVAPGTSGSSITAHDTFTLAQFKDDQLQGHGHSVYISSQAADLSVTPTRIVGGTVAGANPADISSIISRVGTYDTQGANGTPRTGTVTRGKRIGINFMIKAT